MKTKWRRFLGFGSEKGFTLIEIIFVILFLGGALLAGMNTMSTSLTGGMATELLVVATNLANERMERIFADKKSKGYDYVSTRNYPVEVNRQERGFSTTVQVQAYEYYKQVEVTVSHPDIKSCTLMAYITNY